VSAVGFVAIAAVVAAGAGMIAYYEAFRSHEPDEMAGGLMVGLFLGVFFTLLLVAIQDSLGRL
jgi:hypothetical protein